MTAATTTALIIIISFILILLIVSIVFLVKNYIQFSVRELTSKDKIEYSEKWVDFKYGNDDYELLQAVLFYIRYYLDRLNWNKYQKEIDSPFDNNGSEYRNGYVKIRAYDWDNNYKPNFESEDIKVWWYKHYNRCNVGKIKLINNESVSDKLANILVKTINSIEEDLGENIDI